jgi:hypothetical protein
MMLPKGGSCNLYARAVPRQRRCMACGVGAHDQHHSSSLP